MRFSVWITLEEIDSNAPEAPGLFQVKMQAGLLIYPTGKSAMFYYGYAENLAQGLNYFRSELLPLLEIDQEQLLARWLTAEDTKVRFQNHLNAFLNSFGSLPSGNEMLLQKRSA